MAKPRTGNTTLLQVRISPAQKAALERLAAANNTTVSELVRRQVRSMCVASEELLVLTQHVA